MSLYEVVSMNLAMEKLDGTHKPRVSDDEWEKAEAMLAAVTVNDPSVKLH